MKSYNVNDYITIYPTLDGWIKIKQILRKSYNMTEVNVDEYIERRRHCDGYKDQMWVIYSELNEIFFNGQTYLKTSIIDLNGDIIYDNEEIRKMKLDSL